MPSSNGQFEYPTNGWSKQLGKQNGSRQQFQQLAMADQRQANGWSTGMLEQGADLDAIRGHASDFMNGKIDIGELRDRIKKSKWDVAVQVDAEGNVVSHDELVRSVGREKADQFFDQQTKWISASAPAAGQSIEELKAGIAAGRRSIAEAKQADVAMSDIGEMVKGKEWSAFLAAQPRSTNIEDRRVMDQRRTRQGLLSRMRVISPTGQMFNFGGTE
jgi:hypothetical protein